jgi:hypothetical protein
MLGYQRLYVWDEVSTVTRRVCKKIRQTVAQPIICQNNVQFLPWKK